MRSLSGKQGESSGAQPPQDPAAVLERVLEDVPTELLIGGDWHGASDGGMVEVDNPATGDFVTSVADGTVADGIRALDAAAEAAPVWAASSPMERSEVLTRAFEAITARTEDLAVLMTTEMGKPLAEARGEVKYAADYFRWYAAEALRTPGRYGPTPDGAGRILVRRRPVGPTLMVTPWNFPLAMAARKIAPAVAAGCTMVLKPAEQTPLTALLMAHILEDVGLPGGVLNLVTTSNPGPLCEAIMADARLRKVTFTGSTQVGSTLLEQAARHVLRSSMELGGNAPFIVFDDADLDAAVDGLLAAKMRNMGEACTAANRVFVHERLERAFTKKVVERMKALKVGVGTDPASDVGPLIDEDAVAKVDGLVADAVERGATVHCGGRRVRRKGRFYPPTVLTGIDPASKICREEIFGPVAAIQTFTDEDDVVHRANDTAYGLAAYVYTADVQRAMRLPERLEYGMVGINQGVVSQAAAPFGGVKHSGLGREGGAEGLEEYLETQYLAFGG